MCGDRCGDRKASVGGSREGQLVLRAAFHVRIDCHQLVPGTVLSLFLVPDEKSDPEGLSDLSCINHCKTSSLKTERLETRRIYYLTPLLRVRNLGGSGSHPPWGSS